MTDAINTWKRPGRGRPRIDERGEIIAHFTREIDNGRTITEIAARGLNILGYKYDRPRQTYILCVLRKYKGPNLERRYREFLEEVRRSGKLDLGSIAMRGGLSIGPGRRQMPLSFPSPKAVRRGRPRGKSTGR
jgi:hypothetical protein